VAGCGGLHDAPDHLFRLTGQASPLLELFYTISHNTAVADPQIKATFQPAQVLVDPNAQGNLIGPGNKVYTDAVLKLSSDLGLVAQNPQAATDPNAFATVTLSAAAASDAAKQAWQTFTPDPQWHTENTVLSLLQAPIQCASNLAPKPGGAANGGGAKICGALSPLLAKFPFAPTSSTQASLAEVNGAFAPDTGAIWVNYNALLKPYLVQQGAQFAAAPNPPQPVAVNPKFAQYLSRLAHVSAGLYPVGAKSPAFNFNLRFLPSPGISSATLVVDGQRIPAGSTNQQFRWDAATAQKASLMVDTYEIPFQGTWSLFQLVHTAHVTRSPGGYRLDFPLDNTVTLAGRAVTQSSSAKTASFELSGPGAEALTPEFFSGLGCVAPVVK
jgi:type VI secretion system protein ImpL